MSTTDATDTDHTYPAFVDWAIAGLTALAGLFSLVGGAAVLLWVDRELIASGVEEEGVQDEFLTEPELIDLATATARWTGIGLAVVGLLLVLGGLGYGLYRRRTRDRAAAGATTGDYVGHAFVGAVVASILSFVPFSTVIGGGVAGYLEREQSGRTVSVGASSGVLPAIPVSLLLAFTFAGLVLGASGAGRGGLAAFLALAGLLTLATVVAVGAVTGAIGGWVGGKLHDRETERGSTPAGERGEADARSGGTERVDGGPGSEPPEDR